MTEVHTATEVRMEIEARTVTEIRTATGKYKGNALFGVKGAAGARRSGRYNVCDPHLAG